MKRRKPKAMYMYAVATRQMDGRWRPMPKTFAFTRRLAERRFSTHYAAMNLPLGKRRIKRFKVST